MGRTIEFTSSLIPIFLPASRFGGRAAAEELVPKAVRTGGHIYVNSLLQDLSPPPIKAIMKFTKKKYMIEARANIRIVLDKGPTICLPFSPKRTAKYAPKPIGASFIIYDIIFVTTLDDWSIKSFTSLASSASLDIASPTKKEKTIRAIRFSLESNLEKSSTVSMARKSMLGLFSISKSLKLRTAFLLGSNI